MSILLCCLYLKISLWTHELLILFDVLKFPAVIVFDTYIVLLGQWKSLSLAPMYF